MKDAKVVCFMAVLLVMLSACGETSVSSEHGDGDSDSSENTEDTDGDSEDAESVDGDVEEPDGDVTEGDDEILPDGDEENQEADVEELEVDVEDQEADDGCAPDSSWCEENTLHVCDETGREYVPEDCEAYTCSSTEDEAAYCRPEHALSFDGTTGYVQLSDDFLARKQVHSTVEAWVYWPGAGDEPSPVYSEGSNIRFGLTFGSVSNQYVHLVVHCSDDTWSNAQWNGVLSEGWYHIAGVNTPSKRMLFVDGELVAEVESECLQDTTAQEPSYLGASCASGVVHPGFNGIIDEVRVSDAARYTETFTPEVRFEPDDVTIALWHMDEGDGTTATDEVSEMVAPMVGGVEWVPGKTDHQEE